jgi:two-component system CheB/CheR fusion protein
VNQLRTPARYAAAVALVGAAAAFRVWLLPLLGFANHDGALLVAIVIASTLLGVWPAIVVTLLGSLEFQLVRTGYIFPRSADELGGFLIFLGEGIVIIAATELWGAERRLRRKEAVSRRLLAEYERELFERDRNRVGERQHELWLEVILSSIADGLIVTDEHGTITFVNNAGEKLIGITNALARGRPIDAICSFVDEATGETLSSPVREALKKSPSKPSSEKTSLRRTDGQRLPVVVSSAVMRNDRGLVTGSVVVIHDMRHTRELETRRADSEGRFAALADSVPALIWMSSNTGSWEYFNSAWHQLTGRTTEEQCGFGWTESIHPDDAPSCIETYNTSFEAKRPFRMEYRLRDRNGYYRWVSNRGIPRYNSAGHFVGFIGSCVDVTEHREAEETARRNEEQLRRLNAELERFSGELARTNVELELQNRTIERANEQKARFLATMSHELRTPMNSVVGFVDLLSEESSGPLNAKQRGFIAHIRNAGHHLLRLVENVLDFSRLEAGRLHLDSHEFAARPVVQEVVTGVLQTDRDKQVKVSVSVPDDFMVYADAQRFRQILYNLTSNAFKFTAKGGEISVSTKEDENFTYLSIRDTGVGIARDQLGLVFEEFHQARSPDRNKGAGLGLAITQRLVQAHGGSISAESKVGEGTCLTFSLPKSKRQAPPTHDNGRIPASA